MSDSQPINPLLLAARQELQAKINKINRYSCHLRGEEFKELLTLRGRQALMERKDQEVNFVIDDYNREVLNLLYHYACRTHQNEINSLAGIVLNGKYGCGKSALMSAFVRVLNDIHFFGQDICEEIHSIDLAEQIRLKGVLPYIRKPLLIQDLGKEPDIVNAFGTNVNPIANLLSIRAEYGAMTYGSMNMDKAMFSEFYKDKKLGITKRFTEHVNLIFLPGESRRKDYSINQK